MCAGGQVVLARAWRRQPDGVGVSRVVVLHQLPVRPALFPANLPQRRARGVTLRAAPWRRGSAGAMVTAPGATTPACTAAACDATCTTCDERRWVGGRGRGVGGGGVPLRRRRCARSPMGRSSASNFLPRGRSRWLGGCWGTWSRSRTWPLWAGRRQGERGSSPSRTLTVGNRHCRFLQRFPSPEQHVTALPSFFQLLLRSRPCTTAITDCSNRAVISSTARADPRPPSYWVKRAQTLAPAASPAAEPTPASAWDGSSSTTTETQRSHTKKPQNSILRASLPKRSLFQWRSPRIAGWTKQSILPWSVKIL